jgi:lipopolysaccharide export system permease protein
LFGILHRTIFGELAKVFFLALVGITGIIVLATIVVEASQHGLSPMQILAVIPLIVPSMLPFIIPPTTLFTACVVYGRLAHDNEILAIKAAGVNVLFAIWPGIFLGVLMSGSTVGLYYELIPRTHLMFRTLASNSVEEFLYAMLKRDHEILRKPELRMDYEMWVGDVQGRILKNAIFKRRDKDNGYDVIGKAREAELRVDQAKGVVIVHLRNCEIIDRSNREGGHFVDYLVEVPLPIIDKQKPNQRALTWPELLQARREAAEEVERVKMEEALTISQESLVQLPVQMLQHRSDLEYRLAALNRRLYALDTELHLRPALSFGCLFFVLVGCPVGIWFSRSDYLSAFISCFLPIVFIYYPLLLCATNLAKDGKLDAALAMWTANGVVGLLSIGLFWKLLKN